ncbi:MAG TPA: hypothetical protein VMD99_12525 [Terriglobales bacterium]|nr:hypothetical protein [Terriglobales bacterium]
MPISAAETITLAFQHTKRQLIQPFRFWQWTRLAFVGLLAGEAGSGSSFHLPPNFNTTHHAGSSGDFLKLAFPNVNPVLLAALIAIVFVAGLIFAILMTYVSSVMRFILFDSVLAKECRIRQGWRRRQDAGWKYFWWQLGFILAIFAGLIVLLGIPAALAFAMGWFHEPSQHVLGLVLGGILLFLLLFVFLVASAVIQVLTKDFVVPQMALEGIGAVQGWRRLWPMIDAELGGYAAYVGMKIVLAIGAGIVVALVGLILILLVAIPVAGVAVATVLGGNAAGLTWNVFTITAAVVAGCLLIAVMFYLVALISVPVIVFFPAYSIYFFAARYRPLSLVLYPPPPPLSSDAGPAPPGEPPFAPVPAG